MYVEIMSSWRKGNTMRPIRKSSSIVLALLFVFEIPLLEGCGAATPQQQRPIAAPHSVVTTAPAPPLDDVVKLSSWELQS